MKQVGIQRDPADSIARLSLENKPRFPFLAAESDEMLHLDLLRFYAAYGIVFLHLRNFLEIPARHQDLLTTRAEALALFVDLFFVISGFVISFVYAARMKSRADYKKFMRRRAARLVPLHWLTLGAYAVLGFFIISQGVPVRNPSVWDFDCFWSNFALVHATAFCGHISFNTVSWSISAELFMYLLFPCFLWLMGRNRILFVVALVVVLAGLFGVPLVAPAAPWYRWTSQGGVFRALPSFLFGMLLFELRVKLLRMPFPRATCWGALLLFLVGAEQAWPAPVLLAILYVVVAMGVAADVQRRGGKPLRLLAPWGKLTYSVYMLHGLVMIVLLNVLLDRVLSFHGAARNAVVVLAMLAVMPVSYLSYTWFETPARRWLGGERRLSSPQSAAANRLTTGEILARS